MTQPPQTKAHAASITNPSSALAGEDEANLTTGQLRLGSDVASAYEILRREGELHEGRGTVLDDLRKNLARLEDLHGQLHFLMKEVELILRR